MSNAGFHRTWLCPSCHLHSACNHHPQSAVFPVWIRRLTLIRPLFRRRFWLGSTKTMKHASKILKLFPAACWRQMQTSGFWQRPPYSILTRRRNLTILIASSATCHLSGAVSAAPIWHGWRFGSFEVFTLFAKNDNQTHPWQGWLRLSWAHWQHWLRVVPNQWFHISLLFDIRVLWSDKCVIVTFVIIIVPMVLERCHCVTFMSLSDNKKDNFSLAVVFCFGVNIYQISTW